MAAAAVIPSRLVALPLMPFTNTEQTKMERPWLILMPCGCVKSHGGFCGDQSANPLKAPRCLLTATVRAAKLLMHVGSGVWRLASSPGPLLVAHLIRSAATLTHSHPCSFGLRPLLTANSFRRFPSGSSLPPSDAEKELFCGTFSRRGCLRTATNGQHRANFRYA